MGSDPRQTEERLRHHLDSNQAMRERLCLALMPLIGPYTQEKPRRPKGGPDGGRDIEAIYEGAMTVWGAVGFRNGGGQDDTARRDAGNKFKADLDRAMEADPLLKGFVFFTNVDLTPAITEGLRELAAKKGVEIVDIIDLERIRHALDSPEGLIPRLQYLDIPMSTTEQVALVNKFGSQLQNAVAARFDRVERTLAGMERFLDFQKPIYRMDSFVALRAEATSAQIGDEGLLLRVTGLEDIHKKVELLLWNQHEHIEAERRLVSRAFLWLDKRKDKVVPFIPSLGLSPQLMTSFCEMSLSTAGHRVRIADVSAVHLQVFATTRIAKRVSRVILDCNGYELFDSEAQPTGAKVAIELPRDLTEIVANRDWEEIIPDTRRELLFSPPSRSGRLLPLRRDSCES